ncbi:MAG TPA: tetratricopeptide repeat protein [Chloroflexia bacterium]|nr:tetratricopeptide repeat protein [Chloroflexia bacterium]
MIRRETIQPDGDTNLSTKADGPARKVGLLVAAVALCALLISLFPRTMSTIYLNQGNVLSLANTPGKEKESAERALDAYRQSLSWNGMNAQAYHRAGYAYLQQGKVDEAISNLAEAVRLAPEKKRLYSYWLGKAYERAGRDREAIEAMLQASYPLYFEALADSYANKGDLVSAQRVYSTAIDLNLNPARAYTDLGVIFYNNGRCAEAESPLLKGLELQSENARAAYYLGVCALASGDLDQALLQSRKAVEIEPQNVYYRMGLAEAYEARGELKEAVQQWQAAHELSPDDGNVQIRIDKLRAKIDAQP